MNEANRENAGEGVQAERALKFVQTLLSHMDIDADATISPDAGEDEDDREVRIEIEGPDAGRVIGKRGVVLEAIQYLTTRVAHRPGEDRLPICVDAEGYRARHEEQLAAMAAKLAERVAAEGKIVTFDPMNPRDRRVVHMAVRDIAGVRTESNGNGHDRRVQIIPDRNKVADPAVAQGRDANAAVQAAPARAAAPAKEARPARAPREAAPVEAPEAKPAKPVRASKPVPAKAVAAPEEAAEAPVSALPKSRSRAPKAIAETPASAPAEVVAEPKKPRSRAPKKAD